RAKLTEQQAAAAAASQGPTYLGYDLVARAREARLRVDVELGKLYLEPDRFVFDGKNSQGITQQTSPIAVDLPEHLAGKEIKTRPMALTWDELGPRLADLHGDFDRIAQKREALRGEAARAVNPSPELVKAFALHDRNYQSQGEAVYRQIRNVE